MYACGLKKTQVLFLALRKAEVAPPSPSFQSDRSLAGPSYIPVNIQDMVYPEVSAESSGTRHWGRAWPRCPQSRAWLRSCWLLAGQELWMPLVTWATTE